MTTVPSLRPQPMLAVADVERASRWYQEVLDLVSNHGGGEYEQLLCDGAMVLQLHTRAGAHHHLPLADADGPLGNGVAVWFQADDFDALVACARAAGAEVVTDVHVNPNAGQRELWLRDLDGYLVVVAETPPAR